MKAPVPHSASFESALHGGILADRISASDWSHHPLGPAETWPPSLRAGIRLMLASRQPMWLGWGPELHVFYNDAFASTLGSKEVWALGAPAAKVWAEVWDLLGPRTESVLHTGAATWDESLRLILERGGEAEETYHTFSCSPISDDDSVTGGVLCVTTENTDHVIRERRLTLLDEVGSALANASTEPDLFRILHAELKARSHDVPFGLVYIFEGANAILAGSHGVDEGSDLAPSLIATHAAHQPWPAGELLAQSAPVVVGNLDARTAGLPTGLWDKPPHQALIVRIEEAGKKTPAGFFVAGINPYRPLDPAYTAFLESLARRIGSTVATIRAGEAERKRADALAELDRAKTAFFVNVSHELRTPLTLLLAPMQELLAAPDVANSPHLRELAAVAHRNGRRLLKVVNTLLDFSRLDAGRMQASFVATDLAHFTSELASAFRSAVERVGLKFVVDCPPLDEPVFVDRDMWEKIVLNLLSNAFKFTLTGAIRVSLCATNEGVDFSVRDTGAGIPPEARPHLFDRFFRARVNQGRTHEGTGIGLALVHELVKLHQGTLRVESEVGQGTTITVSLRKGRAHLPVDESSPATPASAGAITTSPGETSQWSSADMSEQGVIDETLPSARAGERGGRVLVVDDNADLRSYVARLLSSHFEVVMAADGISALEIIENSKPDLVMTDAMMPGLDGFGLLRAIRSRPDLRTIPVILLSARAGEDSRIEGLDAGADDFLVKPFSGRELLARVKVHVQMARIRGQAEERERELRTRAEVFASALRESSERLSASLAAAGTGTFRWDLRTNLLDFDESLDRLFGLLPGQNARPLAAFLELIHPDDRSRVRAACERCLRVGANFDLEYRITRPDGSIRWLEDKAETFFDEMGKPAYMTGACVDITKRKQAENFVWRQKDVLEQIVQGAPLADVLETLTLDVEQVAERTMIATVLMADAAGTQLKPVAGRRCPAGWTQAIEAFPIGPLEGSAGAAAFRKERVIVPDVMTSPLWEKYRLEAVKHGLRACWATPILSSHGTVLGTFAIYHPEPDTPTEDEIRFVDIVTRTAAIAVERDHFEVALNESQAQLAGYAQRLEERVQERTAKLQETVSDLESFSYSISHDMRAPLRAMQSFAQILAEECGEQIGAGGKDYIRRIIGASDRMDRLIQDVLTYSRVTRTELQLEPVNVETLLDGILESYPQFQPPQARIEVRRPLPRVMANEAGLVQCLSNLIGNAIKFVGPGVTPRVEIWAETHADRVRLFVRDNGIGIEPDAHEKIFNIFYQLDRNYDGTGIGLSVVRKAAERMGGSVGLKSELNRGSTFHLEFALAN